MAQLFKDSGLDNLKGSIQHCPDCGKPTVHYRTSDGWPICHACGYNPQLMDLAENERANRSSTPRRAA